MLTLTFLGVGSAFAKRSYQSNALVEAWSMGPDGQSQPDDTMLIDFGATGPLALHRLMQEPGFSYLNRDGRIYYPAIRRVFITHLHGDHIAGLEELAVMNSYAFVDPTTQHGFRPQLVGGAEVIERLWDHSLRGGLGARGGRLAQLDDYFDVVRLRPAGGGGPDRITMLGRYELSSFPTDHIRIHRKHDWPSFGLSIEDITTGASVFYSGDTRFDPDGLGDKMSQSCVNFHEVQLEEEPAPVHTLLSELATLPEAIRRKTYLYHYEDAWDSGAYDFVRTEFAGFATPGHRYVLFA